MKTYYMYVFKPTDYECKTKRTNAEILAARGIQVPDGITPLVVDHENDKLDIQNMLGDVVDCVVLLDDLRWKTVKDTLKIDIMKLAHHTLATTSRRAVNVVLVDDKIEFALKASW